MTFPHFEIIRRLVGGAVRDKIMHSPIEDRDWLVTDKTEDEMITLGFQRIGKSSTCPVFIHPKDPAKEEHAIPRTEVSTGPGYKDFIWSTENVSVHEDLKRRDFTINAMMECNDTIFDPFNGKSDIEHKIIRHIDAENFKEDPLRILRAARFAARFGFTIASQTVKLCNSMCRGGMLNSISGERITIEIQKVFKQCKKPSMFFRHLAQLGALEIVLPEINDMVLIPQPLEHHGEGVVFNHTMLALDKGKYWGRDVPTMFAILFHDIGKTLTDPQDWPSHHGHDGKKAVEAFNKVSKRLKLDKITNLTCRNAISLHMKFHRLNELSAGTVVKMFRTLRVKHTMEHLDRFVGVGNCDEAGRIPELVTRVSIDWIDIAHAFQRHEIDIRTDREFSSDAKQQMVMQQEVNCIKQMLRKLN